MTQVSLTTSTNYNGPLNALVEDEGTTLVIRFDLDEPAPAGGLKVYINSELEQSLNRLNLPAIQVENINLGTLTSGFNGDNSGIAVDINAGKTFATITLPIFNNTEPDTFLPATFDGLTEVTYTVQTRDQVSAGDLPIIERNGRQVSDYTVDSDASSSLVYFADTASELPTVNPTPTIGLSATPTDLVEEDGTLMTLTINLSEAPPEGGVNVTIDSDVPNSLVQFDVLGAAYNGAQLVGPNQDVSGFTVIVTEQTATITLAVFDDAVDEGPQTITYALQAGDGYEIDSAASAISINIDDNDAPTEPVVSFSATPTTINEAEGTALVMNFSVDGDIPEGGITVNLEGDAARIMQQFTVAQTRFNDDGEIFYRFDNGFANNTNSNIVGGTLNRFSLEDGDSSESASNPEAAGDAFLSNFSFTITEPTASITIPVIDDLFEEMDETYTYTLVEGDGYMVDSSVNSATFTVTDGVVGGIGPTVGVSATPTDLVESEQTALTLTFTTEGDIPPEGLVVVLEGPPRAIAEFDVNATNPRLPENETVVTGPVVTGGSIVGTNEVVGGLLFRITDPTATITVPVFQDDVEEGTETLNFNLRDGEMYNVDADASAVSITIEDVSDVVEPTVSFSTTPTTINEAEGTALVMNFSVDGDIPEGGITVNLEGDAARIMQQFTVAQTRFNDDGEIFYRFDNGFANNTNGNIVGGTLNRFSLEDGDPSEAASNPEAAGDAFLSNFSFTITEANASITIPVFDDIIEEADATYTYKLVSGDGYSINPEANSGTFTVTDGVVGGEGPRVEISATPGTLYEKDATALTVNLRTRGDIPEDGLVVFIEGPARAIAEFDVNATNPRLPEDETEVTGPVVTGGSIVGTNEAAGGFFFRITEGSSSITVPVFQDDVEEGSETFTFTLRDGEEYQVREGRESITVTIDDVLEPPVVSMTGSPTLLRESDGTSLELNFSATGTIPESGTTVVLEITDPALSGIQISRPSNEGDNVGITIPSRSRQTITDEDGNFVKLLQRVTITEANATLRLPVVDDIFLEEDAEYTINLVEGEGYNIDTAATNSATFTVSDGDLPAEVPTIGVNATPNNLYESEQTVVNLSFNLEGDIPSEGVQVFLDSGVQSALGEFDINGSARTGEVEGLVVSGGEVIGTDNDASGFFFRMDEANATIQVPVFPDDVEEGAETFTFTLAQGEAYNIDQNASAVNLTIDDVAEPVVSFSVNTTTLSEEEATLFTFSFGVNGVIPEGGVEVALGGELLPFIDQLDFSNFDFSNPDNVQGLTIGDFSEDGAILLNITEPSASLSVRVFDDVVKEADASFDLMLLEAEGYSVNQEAKGATVTVTDGVIVDNPPTVALSVSDSSLTEGEEFTVNFSVDGDVSEDNPLTVLVNSTEVGALGEFNIFNEDGTPAYTTTGIQGTPRVGDDTGSSFLVELTDTEASITLPVFNDGIGEGTETVNFALVEGERYNVDGSSNTIALTIEETPVEVKFEANENGEVSKFAYDLTGAGAMEVLATVDQDALDITDAAFDNLVGFYEVVDENGGIDTDGDGVADFNPGDAGYAKAALENAVDGMALRLGGNPNDDTTAGSFGDAVIQGGKSYAPFAIANAGDMTVADFLAANPNNDAATSIDDQVAYFAFGEANPDGANHLKSWGDGIFGFEDLPDNLGVSDNDFNDAVFKFNFTA